MEQEDPVSKIKTLYNTINNLKDSLNLKDDQVSTMQSTLNLKDEQVKSLENSLKLKEEKITALEKTVALKEEELKAASESKVDEEIIIEKEKKIEDLQKEIELLNEELNKADEEIEHLEIECEKLKETNANSSDAIVDFSNSKVIKSEILNKMREILQSAISSITIVVPNITDLQDLYLYEVRSSVSIKISCEINPGVEENAELLDEYESLDNITLRNFTGGDRYVIMRDGEELLFAIMGEKDDNHLVLHTTDPSHIRFLSSITVEAWLRSRKI